MNAASAGERPAVRRGRVLLLLGALIAIGPLTTDMYLPALPAMTDELRTNASGIQFTLTGTLIGLAGGQVFVGPLSDAIGRRKPLLAGIVLHVLASLACVFAPGLGTLYILRVLQGIGSATFTVIAMAVVRDLFEGRATATALSRLMLVIGVAPILAPLLGSVVLQWSSWRGVFAVLAGSSLVIGVVAAIALPETLPVGRRQRGGLVGTIRDYGRLLRDGRFIGLILLAGFAMSVIFAFVAGSPFALQGQFGLNEQEFGLVFGAGALFNIIGTQLNVVALARRPPAQVLVVGLLAATVTALVLLICAVTDFGGLWGILLPLWATLLAVASWPRTLQRWRCRDTVRSPELPQLCSVPSSSASARSRRLRSG